MYLHVYHKITDLKKILLILSILCQYTGLLKAQSDTSAEKSRLLFESGVYTGKTLDIYPGFPETKQTIYYEINVAKQTNGKREWNGLYNYPQIGLSFIYGYLGNNDILGQNYAVVPNIVFSKRKNYNWGFETKIGFGFSYFNKPYDIKTNPENIVIGTHLTNISLISFDFKRDISPKLTLKAGVSFFHFSEGHVKVPNVGINTPALNFAVKYFPCTKPFIDKGKISKAGKGNLLFNVQLGLGTHAFFNGTSQPTNGPVYPVYLASFYLSKMQSRIDNIYGGFDVKYYTAFYDYIINNDFYDDNQHLKSMVAVGFLGHEFIIGRLGFVTQFGVYLYNPFRKDLQLEESGHLNVTNLVLLSSSNRFGLNYYLLNPEKHVNKNIFAGMFIKANFAHADYLEFDLGFRF